jgi:hypothetical protein
MNRSAPVEGLLRLQKKEWEKRRDGKESERVRKDEGESDISIGMERMRTNYEGDD